MRLKNGVELGWAHLAIIGLVGTVSPVISFLLFSSSVWLSIQFLQWVGAL